jgi:hypothetical protein
MKLWVSLVLTAALSAGCCHISDQPLSADEYYPLHKGTVWKYTVSAEWWTGSGTNGKTQKRNNITERETVLDTFSGGNIHMVHLRKIASEKYGWADSRTADYLVIRVGSNHYYKTNYHKELWDKIVASGGHRYLEELANMDIILETPLQEGALFGDRAETPRGEYCHHVIASVPFDPTKIKGAPKLNAPRAYTLMFRTRPDHSFTTFVPGLGFAYYEYAHHGTTFNMTRDLVEYQPGKIPAKDIPR